MPLQMNCRENAELFHVSLVFTLLGLVTRKEAVSGILPEHNLLVIQIIILPQCRLVVFCLVLFESFCELRDDNFYVTNDS